MAKYSGECFCGACSNGSLRGTGSHGLLSLPIVPFVVGWTGQCFHPLEPEAVKITAGAEHVDVFQKTAVSQRQYCKKCGGHLMTNHPPLGLVDVYSATLPTLKYSPAVHVNYAETVLPMKDGLPKLRISRRNSADRASRCRVAEVC